MAIDPISQAKADISPGSGPTSKHTPNPVFSNSSITQGQTKAGSTGFCSTCYSYVKTVGYYIFIFPVVKTYEYFKWIIYGCQKESKSEQPKVVDILPHLTAEDLKASAQTQAKDTKAFFSNLLANCLSDPEKMEKAFHDNKDKIVEFGNEFNKAISPNDPLKQPGEEVELFNESFITKHISTFASALEHTAKIFSDAIKTHDDNDLSIEALKGFFAEFLPDFSNKLKNDPEKYKMLINRFSKSHGHILPNFLSHVIPMIDDIDSFSGANHAQFLYKDLAQKTDSNLESPIIIKLSNDLNFTADSLNLKIYEKIKFSSFKDLLTMNLFGSLTPSQIDELKETLPEGSTLKFDNAILCDGLRNLQGTKNRADGLRVYGEYLSFLEDTAPNK